MAGDIAFAVAAKVAEYTVEPVFHQLSYLFFYKRNVNNLKTQVAKLEGETKDRVQRDVDAANENGEEIHIDVRNWLRRVDELIKEATVFYADRQRCKDKVSYRVTPPVVTSISSKGYKAIESRTRILTNIMETLRDGKLKRIGIWGPGGVGKTTLAKQVAKEAQKDNMFGKVVIVTMTVEVNVNRVRGEIADALGLRFEENSEVGRANRLRVPLEDEHKGSTFLLISRNHDVLKSEMGIQKGFLLQVLEREEAWSLFKELSGNTMENPELEAIAIEIAEGFAGLPSSIATVAKALKDKDIYAWKDALNRLKKVDKEGHGKIHSALELSYHHLEDEEAKALFLLIGLQGRYYVYKYDLLIFALGMGLFKNINSLEEARARLHKLTKNLHACSLLVEDETRWVAIHDDVRGIAVLIASKDQQVFSKKVYSELNEWPEMDTLRRCRGIYLPWCYMRNFPERLESPQLEVLALENYSNDYLRVPDSLFEETRELKVLDICGMMCVPKPPLSLHFLTNLQVLYLYWCKLDDITMIGDLYNLQVLNLCKSDIKHLPEQIGKLGRLRLLDLDSCSSLQVIPPKVLSNLTSLEELYMGNSFVNWESCSSNTGTNACLVELMDLHRLTTLDLPIPKAEILPMDFLFRKLERFRVYIGDGWSWDGNYESRRLKLKLSTKVGGGVRLLLQNAEDLSLDELPGVKNVVNDLNEEGFPELKHLSVQNNVEIHCIFNSIIPSHAHCIFPNLDSLALNNLSNLEHICHGPSMVEVEIFCKLRNFQVNNCHRLKNLFLFSMIRSLSQLVEVQVSGCRYMKEIVISEKEDSLNVAVDGIQFPQLLSLTLQNLPALVTFCSTEITPSTSQRRNQEQAIEIETKEIKEVDKQGSLLPLFNHKISFPNLETMVIKHIPKLRTIWHQQDTAKSFQNLATLEIDSCARLINLMMISMAKSLVHLKTMKICNCENIEEIVSTEGKNFEDVITFNLLESLALVRLPCFKSFCSGNHTFNFPSLKEVIVEECPKMEMFCPGNLFAPMLKVVTQEYSVQCWKGDLNTTIKHLFMEMHDSSGK
ncbi:Disease resistance protein [Quillaja saponaria]|uniref:Disease resistance protein n=1 Tax=Quillaja saponaria TaxID=32244 RepID=A0AAD7L4Y1_QUISA|nr:Disease resistance protein [Quillaja saponaria]